MVVERGVWRQREWSIQHVHVERRNALTAGDPASRYEECNLLIISAPTLLGVDLAWQVHAGRHVASSGSEQLAARLAAQPFIHLGVG